MKRRWKPGDVTVIIDPEDDEAVRDLIRCYGAPLSLDRLQAALREYADPTPPKPDEPQGLGAVVEDSEGGRFVRTGTEGWGWYEVGLGPTSWNMINAVRVLSPGVTEGAES